MEREWVSEWLRAGGRMKEFAQNETTWTSFILIVICAWNGLQSQKVTTKRHERNEKKW